MNLLNVLLALCLLPAFLVTLLSLYMLAVIAITWTEDNYD
jgi:hypothetical protein